MVSSRVLRTVKIPLVLLVLFASSAGLVDVKASPAGDLSGDDAVDWQDMLIFSGQWLALLFNQLSTPVNDSRKNIPLNICPTIEKADSKSPGIKEHIFSS